MLKIYIMLVLLAGGAQLALAQKTVILSGSTLANVNILPVVFVKLKGFNAFQKLTFGEYAVVSGKWSFPMAPESSNIWGTKTKTKSSRKFSFVLTDTARDTVKVEGVMKTVDETITPLQVSKSFSVGSDAELGSLNFSANIAVAGDTAAWTLSMKTESGGETVMYDGFLTDGKRTIVITPIYTDHYELPANGYEFTENGQFYSAYLFSTSRTTYLNSYNIYLEKGLDPKLKMALSGAMTALLDLKKTW